MSPFAFVVVLAQVPPAGPTSATRAELMAAADASPRPAMCMDRPVRGQAGRTLWDRARRPTEATFCDALARGYSQLWRAPERALGEAERAKKVLPKRAEPVVLAGRALMQMNRAKEAWAEFQRAETLSKRSLEEPSALHDVAAAAHASGHKSQALALFRRLVPRASLLSKGTERQRVYLEAALLVMAEGPENLNEATGYLVEARRFRGAPGLADVVTGALALALDRQGQTEEAHGVAAEAGGPGAA
jgi:tetratricopeptide (TPR) repeat protein